MSFWYACNYLGINYISGGIIRGTVLLMVGWSGGGVVILVGKMGEMWKIICSFALYMDDCGLFSATSPIILTEN